MNYFTFEISEYTAYFIPQILVALLIFGLPFIGGLYVNVYFNSAESDEKWYNTLVTTEFQPPFYIFGPGKLSVVLDYALFLCICIIGGHILDLKLA